MRTRAFRRHHLQRVKHRVASLPQVVCYGEHLTPTVIGKYARTRVPCSCWMCGNPRRHFDEITMQEKRAA